MADVDKAKLQFIRDCAVQALRVWIDAPERLDDLVPKFEKGYDRLTERGYGHPWRVQIEAGLGRGAAAPEQKPQPPTLADQHRVKERELSSEVLHWQRLSQQQPNNETWAENWRRAYEALQEHMLTKPGQINEQQT